ncbi:hypothetical protein HPB47_006752 [Ixodes persulcatus]|uniref:Uncharacterized protein n=1 Tax=Ixodes persulcatus TaxID=34615 RepID=A0AC60P9L6_IXOPE|nr:hypothetical protein HPB47_006752 [Ixodes persulcatus]
MILVASVCRDDETDGSGEQSEEDIQRKTQRSSRGRRACLSIRVGLTAWEDARLLFSGAYVRVGEPSRAGGFLRLSSGLISSLSLSVRGTDRWCTQFHLKMDRSELHTPSRPI